jgi:hypothetical protein
MPDRRGGGKWADRFANHPWLWPAATAVVLLAIAVVLVPVAGQLYDSGNPNGFPSVVATSLMNGAGAAALGAAIASLLALTTEIRARTERDTRKRLELFRRMRAAHVRVALAQQVLRTQGNFDDYDTQMRALMEVVKDLDEIREEVRASGNLYAGGDRLRMMEGVARESRGNMPPDYDCGLEMRKLVMRAYVYGSEAHRADSTSPRR